MSLKQKLNHWVFNEYQLSVEGLGLYRIAFVLYILFIYGLPDFSWISEQPQYYYVPRLISLGALFTDYPPQAFFITMQVLMVLGYSMLLVGWHTRKVSIILPLMVIVCKTFAYSFGHVDHDIFAWITPLILSGSAWGEAYSIDAYQHRNRPAQENTGWSLHLLVVLMTFAMLSAGMVKFLGGWMLPENKAVYAHLAYNYYVVGRHDLLATHFMHFKSSVLWEFMDWSAVMFELGFMVAMLKREWFRIIIGVACVFHGLNMVMLNIPFTENLGAYLAFLPWTAIALKAPKSIPIQWKHWAILPAAAFCGLCAVPAWIRQPDIRPEWEDAVTLITVGLIGIVILFYSLRTMLKPR